MVIIAMEAHPYPYRTRKLSPSASKILGWQRPGKIDHCHHKMIYIGLLNGPIYLYSSLAQSVEHAAVNRRVVGSSPTGGAIIKKGLCRYLFIYLVLLYSSLAQSVEHAAVNRRVVGSSPTGGAIIKKGLCRYLFIYLVLST